MASVHTLTDLTAGPRAELFEGGRHGDGVELSFFVTHTPPGGGPPLHVHPDAEVFLVEEGEATFTVGTEQLVLASGQVVIVLPETPHRFENTGDDTLRILSMQPSSVVQQTNVQPGEPTRSERRDA